MDLSKIVDGVVGPVHEYVTRTVTPLLARLKSLEDWRATMPTGPRGERGEKGDQGQRGADADPALIEAEVRRAVAALPPAAAGRDGKDGRDGRDGASVEPETVRALMREVVAEMPPARDGKDGAAGRDGTDGRDGVDGQRGEPGADGKDGAAGKDGRDGRDGVDGKPGKDGEPGQRGEQGLQGKDGAPGRDGKDGAPGERGEQGPAGRDADPEHVRTCVERAVADAMPGLIEKAVAARLEAVAPEWQAKAALLVPPGRDGLPGRPGTPGEDGRDGRDGQDGRDGWTPQDLDIALKDGRRLVIAMGAGAHRVERTVELEGLPLYRGVVKSGQTGFKKGDAYTWGGSIYLARRDTDSPPPGDDWQLAVKGTR